MFRINKNQKEDKSDGATSRRRARRRNVEIEVRVRFSALQFSVGGKPRAEQGGLTLIGQTRNISEVGLSFVVSASNIDRYLNRKGCALEIEFKLPTGGAVRLQAVPVHYKKFDLSGTSRGYLVGANYTETGDTGRAQYLEYLRTLR